jgi:GR25 family glycosyltransferase involved in LPS biosynthesis
MWDFIDKIVYINLEHRQDRRDIMQKFFEKGKIPLEKVIRLPAIKKIRGGLGCLESHTQALKMAKENSWKNVLILEDDLEWLDLEGGYKRLEELSQKPDWDVIMLVGWYWKYDFPRIYDANNAGAYLVNSSYYDTLLKNRQLGLFNMKKAFGFHFNSKRNDADSGWKILQKTDKWYGLEPCICRQVDGFSDHCKQHIKASLVYGIGTVEVKKQVYG